MEGASIPNYRDFFFNKLSCQTGKMYIDWNLSDGCTLDCCHFSLFEEKKSFSCFQVKNSFSFPASREQKSVQSFNRKHFSKEFMEESFGLI